MPNRSFKGQAAMEYLMNYGWMMVTITIVLAIILASGVFNPSSYGNEYCVGPSVIDCYNIYSEFNPNTLNGKIILSLRNDFGFPIKLNSITLTDSRGNSLNLQSTDKKDPWSSGAVHIFEFSADQNNMVLGSLNKYELLISYSPCETNNPSSCSSSSYEIKKSVYASPQKKVS